MVDVVRPVEIQRTLLFLRTCLWGRSVVCLCTAFFGCELWPSVQKTECSQSKPQPGFMMWVLMWVLMWCVYPQFLVFVQYDWWCWTPGLLCQSGVYLTGVHFVPPLTLLTVCVTKREGEEVSFYSCLLSKYLPSEALGLNILCAWLFNSSLAAVFHQGNKGFDEMISIALLFWDLGWIWTFKINSVALRWFWY